MRTVKLGEVAEINPRSESVAPDEAVSFVGMAQMNAETAIASPLETRTFSDVSKGYTVFRDGDVLAAKITPCWENGKVGQARLDHPTGVGSTEFHVLRPTSSLNDRYLLHFLRQPSVRASGELRMTGSSGQRRVPAAFFQDLKIPQPPLDEQRRIASILDQSDALRSKRRQILMHLDALIQSIFRDMFGVIGGTHWNRVSLGELVASIDSGTSPNCEVRQAAPGEWGVLKLSAVTYGFFQPDENKAYLGEVGPMTVNEVHPGDVLMTRKNTRELVGAVTLVDQVRSRLLLPDLIFRLHLDHSRLDRRYFQALMMNPAKRLDVRNLSSGSAASMPNISKARLTALQLELPPVELQREFSARIERISVQRAIVQDVLSAEDELFASLRSRAFRGEL